MRFVVVPLAALALSLASAAHAEDTQEIAAEKLFDEGHALLLQKRWAEACEKLAASEALAPAGGTELNLGECLDALGKTASAWGAFRKAAARARSAHATQAEAIANQRAAALEPRLRRVSVVASAPAPDLEIRVDGVVLARDAWGEGIPVDPGEHEIVATRPGFVAFRWRGTITNADARVEVPALEAEPAPDTPDAPSPWMKPAGVGLLATGLVATAVGLGLGARAIALDGNASDACPVAARCSSPDALAFADSARDFALASTIVVVSGLAIAVAGVVVFVVAPKATRAASLYVAPSWSGGLLGGTF